MNERGVASLTAILILMMLSYLIRGTIISAQNYADMSRNFELENRLQLAAESAFEVECNKLCNDETIEYIPPSDIAVTVKVDKNGAVFDGEPAVKILAVAKKNNYFGGGISAYRSVCGFLIEEDGKYKFKGFLHSTI